CARYSNIGIGEMLALLSPVGEHQMAQLIVRDIEDEIVRELKVRAARNGRSAEEEHRQILRRVLHPPKDAASFKEILSQMPDVGDDADFARIDDYGRPVDL